MDILEFLTRVYFLERTLKPESERQLRMSILKLLAFAGDRLSLDDLSEDLLNRWLRTNPNQWSPKTLKRRRADILSIWGYAAEIGLATREAQRRRVRRIVVPRHIPVAWTTDELAAMLGACGHMRRYLPNGVRLGLLAEVTVRVGYDTALRCADMFTLPRARLSTDFSRVTQQKKNGDELLCRVRRSTLDRVNQYPPEVLQVLAWPHKQQYFYEGCWFVMLRIAGLPIGKTEGLQKLRRTSVTHAERLKNGNGALQAGHAPGSRVTGDSYIDPTIAYADRELPPELPTD